jgi:hypothetical protein
VAGRAGAAVGLGVAVAALAAVTGFGAPSVDRAGDGQDVLALAPPAATAPSVPARVAGPRVASPAAVPTVAAPARPTRVRPRPAAPARPRPARTAPARSRALPPPEVRTVSGPPRPPASPAPTTAPRKNSRVVIGEDGYLFIAQDWTVACQYAGKADDAAASIAEVAAALGDGGRPAVVVIGPNKSTVQTAEVPGDGVPQRACAERSAAQYWEAFTSAAGPSALDVRAPLKEAARGEQPYWRLDTHWSPTGGTVFARAVAARLDPLLAGRLTTQRGTYERDGDLAETLGQPAREQISALTTVNPGVTVLHDAPTDIGLRNAMQRTRAEVGPAGYVVPGRTVFVGDSFTAIAVEQLAPLFEEAVFVWAIPEDPLAPVLEQLEAADRVVLEAVERRGWQFRMIQPDVAPALRRLPPRTG